MSLYFFEFDGMFGRKKGNYHAEMGVSIWSCWPKHERLYHGARSGLEMPDEKFQKNVLSNEKNELNFSVDGCPGTGIVIEFYIVETSTDTVVKRINPPEENSTSGTYFKYYAIKDDRDRRAEAKLDHNIHDLPMPPYSRPDMNHYQLQCIAGGHRISFSSPFVPEYNVKPSLFTLNINIKGETRKPVSLKVGDDDFFTKYELSHGRNVYVTNYGADQGHCPKIGVYSGDTVVVEQTYPNPDAGNPEKEITAPYIEAQCLFSR